MDVAQSPGDFATERLHVQRLFRKTDMLLMMTVRSERLAKYNQLLRIEEELGSDAVYAGKDWRFIPWTAP